MSKIGAGSSVAVLDAVCEHGSSSVTAARRNCANALALRAPRSSPGDAAAAVNKEFWRIEDAVRRCDP